MPLNELQDYINLINERTEKIGTVPDEIESNLNDISMAGNTLPGGFF